MIGENRSWALRLPRLQAASEWGIEPVPHSQRILGFFDYFALWSSLGVGLLVLLAGTFIVPGLGLGQALLAILLGTLIGNLLLAVTGVAGSDHGIPTMVTLRGVLGIRGSYVPTGLNILQLIGWATFEVIIMAQAANTISSSAFGLSSYPFWALFFAFWCTLLAVSGPLTFIRHWLEKFAVWLVYLISIYLTWYLFSHYDIGALLRRPGTGELSFWLAVDLVIAMPVSWLPLVGDFSRFARQPGRAFLGTYLGFMLANVWFYALGALFVLALRTEDLVASILSLSGGWLALLLIFVDETDNGFADIYSAAVSGQNVLSKVRQSWLALAAGGIVFVFALTLPIARFEAFLLVVGSVFVPLFGVMAADYFVLRRRRYEVSELYRAGGRYWYRQGLNWVAIAAWAAGAVLYHLIAFVLPWLGASLPSFILAFSLYLLLARIFRHELAGSRSSQEAEPFGGTASGLQGTPDMVQED